MFAKFIFPYITNLWNNLKVSSQLMALPDFKEILKQDLEPNKYKHFSKGSKLGNTLLARL